MATLALSHADRFGWFIPASWRRSHRRERTSAADVSPEDTRARREFLLEVLSRNPDGFSSEMDLQGMMLFYGGRF